MLGQFHQCDQSQHQKQLLSDQRLVCLMLHPGLFIKKVMLNIVPGKLTLSNWDFDVSKDVNFCKLTRSDRCFDVYE